MSHRKLPLYAFTLLLCAALTFSEVVQARCNKKQSCLSNEQCQCYCSRVCHFRDKETGDKPVWVKNDPNKKYCYCKKWDLENYDRENCGSESGE